MTQAHLARLGEWAAALRRSDVPEDVRHAARVQILDMIAAAQAGGRSEEAAPALRAAGAAGASGASRVLATGERLAPVDAAGANAACSMAHDFDDVVWMGHTAHSAVFAPLAVAEHEDAGSEALVDAVVVANEIAGRLGASSLIGPLNGQMWTFLHLVGAAAGAARLLGLDGERTTHALAISLAQPNFALQPAFMRPTSKLLSAATPTEAGIRAAYLAREGLTGAPEILEDARGFWARFTFKPLPMMLDELGSLWVLRTLQLKTFPGCHYFQTACTALERIAAREGGLCPEKVARVEVDTNKPGAEATRFAGEYAEPGRLVEPVNVNFDLATTVAVMLEAGELTPAQMEAGWLEAHTDGIRAWRERTRVRHDPALTARVVKGTRALGPGRAAFRSLRPWEVVSISRRYGKEYRSKLFGTRDLLAWGRFAADALRGRDDAPEAEHAASGEGAAAIALLFPNRVSVRFTDGRVARERVDLPVGSVASPTLREAIGTKLRAACAPVLGEGRSERLLAALLDGGAPEEARALAAMAAPEAAAPRESVA